MNVVPFGVGEFEEGLAQRHPGICDQDVEIAQQGDGVADHLAAGDRVGDVRLDNVGGSPHRAAVSYTHLMILAR